MEQILRASLMLWQCCFTYESQSIHINFKSQFLPSFSLRFGLSLLLLLSSLLLLVFICLGLCRLSLCLSPLLFLCYMKAAPRQAPSGSSQIPVRLMKTGVALTQNKSLEGPSRCALHSNSQPHNIAGYIESLLPPASYPRHVFVSSRLHTRPSKRLV